MSIWMDGESDEGGESGEGGEGRVKPPLLSSPPLPCLTIRITEEAVEKPRQSEAHENVEHVRAKGISNGHVTHTLPRDDHRGENVREARARGLRYNENEGEGNEECGARTEGAGRGRR